MGELCIVILLIGFIASIVLFNLALIKNNVKVRRIVAGVASLFVIAPVTIFFMACEREKEIEVSTVEEFLKITDYVDDSASDENVKIILTADIDFTGIEYKTVDLAGHTLLDGNGHAVKNITFITYEADEYAGVGLFEGYGLNIKNIIFENVTINYPGKTSAVGCLLGRSCDSQNFENVTISGKIYAPNAENVGGFMGSSESANKKCMSTITVKNCVSSLEIQGKTNVGGFLGSGSISAQNSKNTGNVKGKYNVGGVVGNAIGNVNGGENYGKVEANEMVGGIVGYVEEKAIVSKAKNGGEVVGLSQAGGVVGHLGKNATIDGCVNLKEGKVTATSEDVNGNANVGGIVGVTDKGSKVYACTNQGVVVATYSKVGGIIGYSLGGVTNCKHEGSVTGENDVGGIVGHMKNNSTVSTCSVTGTVTGEVRIGGLMGRFGSDDFTTKLKSELGINDITIMNCSVSGEITASSYGGGLIGLIVNDTLEGAYIETNTFDGKLTVGGTVSSKLWIVELQK